ncbi:MAG TPA: TerC/Alx family metal homeostasis membrane protein [Polyangiales bacterium]|nr:TerC/Alx family metal homeostasis membrane protein [Polyangiales bacterium]
MLWFWIGFLVLVLVLLAVDLGVLNRRAHTPSVKEALGWSVGWITLSVLFSVVVYFIYERKLYGFGDDGVVPYSGHDAVLTYLTAFLLEKSLSIDNLFVMVLIFQNYEVPGHLQHRVLFWGILGAVVMRAGMILGGVWLVTNFVWVMYLFGAYLIFQGLLQLKPEKDDDEEEDGPRPLLERAVNSIIPVAHEDHASGHFFVRKDGRLHATGLMVALLSVEGADVVFALDSVPAVLTVSNDAFIVFTSNVFAILGLRSLYFVIAAMMNRFEHLKYALSFILVFVGLKMVLHQVFHIPIWASLGVIFGAVVVGVATSMFTTRNSLPPAPPGGRSP